MDLTRIAIDSHALRRWCAESLWCAGSSQCSVGAADGWAACRLAVGLLWAVCGLGVAPCDGQRSNLIYSPLALGQAGNSNGLASLAFSRRTKGTAVDRVTRGNTSTHARPPPPESLCRVYPPPPFHSHADLSLPIAGCSRVRAYLALAPIFLVLICPLAPLYFSPNGQPVLLLIFRCPPADLSSSGLVLSDFITSPRPSLSIPSHTHDPNIPQLHYAPSSSRTP